MPRLAPVTIATLPFKIPSGLIETMRAPVASFYYTVTLQAMRKYLLIVIASGVSTAALAANAPLNFPVLSMRTATTDACFAAALDTQSLPATCDVLIERAGVDAETLAATHNNRGLILAAMELNEDALNDFDAALELTPRLTEALINRASVLFLLGRYPQALAAFDEALTSMTAERHVVLFNRALTHRALGDVEQAKLDLAEARHLDAEIQQSRQRPQPLM